MNNKKKIRVLLVEIDIRLAFFAGMWIDEKSGKQYEVESISFEKHKAICILNEVGGDEKLVCLNSYDRDAA
ncbi:MAG: hypothetical protein PHE67_00405 [Campylobacterales bacterium]|nr:hypothetical protein [Campylobacterales bacterium]